MMSGAFQKGEPDSEKADKIPPGVVGIYILEGRVLAHAADFRPDRPAGYTMLEAQKSRVMQRLYVEVVRSCASQSLADAQDTYACQQIVERMNGIVELITVGNHPT